MHMYSLVSVFGVNCLSGLVCLIIINQVSLSGSFEYSLVGNHDNSFLVTLSYAQTDQCLC